MALLEAPEKMTTRRRDGIRLSVQEQSRHHRLSEHTVPTCVHPYLRSTSVGNSIPLVLKLLKQSS